MTATTNGHTAIHTSKASQAQAGAIDAFALTIATERAKILTSLSTVSGEAVACTILIALSILTAFFWTNWW